MSWLVSRNHNVWSLLGGFILYNRFGRRSAGSIGAHGHIWFFAWGTNRSQPQAAPKQDGEASKADEGPGASA